MLLVRFPASLLLLAVSVPFSQADDIERFGSDRSSGMSSAVAVGEVSLAHTAQLLPTDAGGNLMGKGNPRFQAIHLLHNLNVCLAEFDGDRSQLVKLNVYVSSVEVAREVRHVFAETFKPDERPAVTFVETALPLAGAAVAVDAVFAVPVTEQATARRQTRGLSAEDRFAHFAVLPPGEAVYISGQAEAADGLVAATRKTMQSLHSTLDHLSLRAEHVVQLKAFFSPMSDAVAVKQEMARFYDGALVPPVSMIEWESSLPIEIEMIAMVPAGARRLREAESVAYITPPGMSASPVFSRVARARGDRTVYVSGLYSRDVGDGEAQVRDIFGRLGEILKESGSDLRHLVKATYYVSDADVSAKLNAVRPDFYDPARPPAASKAMVRGVGRPRRSITLDMIAVTPHSP